MTTAGVVITNDGGNVVLDQDTLNFVLTSKGTGTLTLDAAWPVSPVQSCTLTFTSQTLPLLAFSCAHDVVIQAATHSGSTWTFYITSHGASNGDTFQWWMFDKADNAGITDTFGLRVFDASGELVYHSAAHPLRIVDVISGATLIPATTTETSGRTYAILQCSYFLTQPVTTIGATHTHFTRLSTAAISGNVITTVQTTYAQFNSGSATPGITVGSALWLVIDVTNY